MAKRVQERCHASAPFFVIPVLDTGIQHFMQSHQERCILHNTFMLTNLIKFLDPSVWALG
ncbi:hypothetical protein HCR18_06340 [Wolbachia pipientis]|uniref:hypothetical protein n=1 Tax=Wolbachia pipientis TaxID=955 RepID=UPI0015FD4254|nr:hypothetical protein [Wolbachia pipientis]MBA8758609.1 hypothetical protein [Wolbachia pipientis]